MQRILRKKNKHVIIPVTALRCEDPGTPHGGIRRGDDFSFGQSVHFSCIYGYKVSGSKTRTCLPSGRWSGNETTCGM